ncbi:MAG: dipeptidase [Oscillospiraceae bacterium]|jgi:membrane dipeptidase|nr:dipeptidase [Oscillospiraceae bacterium]
MTLPLFDAHCDTITALAPGETLMHNSKHLSLSRAAKYRPYAQVFAIFSRPWQEGFDPASIDYTRDFPQDVLIAEGEKYLTKLLAEFDREREVLSLCRSASDAQNAALDGKAAGFIAVEGAELLGCDLTRLQDAYNAGVRLINLCWNFDNALCGSAAASGGGLTPLGRGYVRRMQELGVAVDLSHASERTFWDVLEISTRPVLAGHSNSKALCNHSRNLTDAQFRALVSTGGVAGINLCPAFLNDSGAATIDDIVRHIEHFLELGGERTLCLGADWDGVDSLPAGISGVEDAEKIYTALLTRGVAESTIRDIFYNNLMNFLEKSL